MLVVIDQHPTSRGRPRTSDGRRHTGFAFCSIDALSHAIEVFDPTVVISVWSPGWPIRDIDGRPHLHLAMDDIEERSMSTLGKVVPDHRHISAFLEMLEYNADRLLIHCKAGLSRSPALVIVAAVKAGHDPITICVEVRRLISWVQPNRLLLQIADEILGTDMLSAAMTTFSYDRGRGLPNGERAALCKLHLSDVEVAP